MKAQLCHVSAIEIKAQIKINLWRQIWLHSLSKKKNVNKTLEPCTGMTILHGFSDAK